MHHSGSGWLARPSPWGTFTSYSLPAFLAHSLWVHINGDAAFLWFCPDTDGSHPGFVPDGMWSGDRRDVRFLLVGGDEPDSIIVRWSQLLPVDAAYRAAIEYLHSPSPPASVTWFEL